MKMKRKHSIIISKSVKKLASLRGGGSALPGLFIERLDKGFLHHCLEQLPHGVIIISGTNGKTTTTKIVAELLRSSGSKVFTNPTGSNFTRGVAAALLSAVDNEGTLNYDIAVLELDEAYAAQFVKRVAPRYVLLLNVMRDQLDRFGEIDNTARLLESVAISATKGLILNRDDPRIAEIAQRVSKDVSISFFGASTNLRSVFINDDELHTPADQKISLASSPIGMNGVELMHYKDNHVTFAVHDQTYNVKLQLSGVYNFLNAAGAIATALAVTKNKISVQKMFTSLETIQPAFGRGEVFTIHGNTLELILVKNPAGFRLALSSFDPADTAIMIAINDSYADGRDMSWLWDVDFSGLQAAGVRTVCGVRAYDMALRLQYDDVAVATVDISIKHALKTFLSSSKNQPKRIFCTYTAMLTLRRDLKKYVYVENIS